MTLVKKYQCDNCNKLFDKNDVNEIRLFTHVGYNNDYEMRTTNWYKQIHLCNSCKIDIPPDKLKQKELAETKFKNCGIEV